MKAYFKRLACTAVFTAFCAALLTVSAKAIPHVIIVKGYLPVPTVHIFPVPNWLQKSAGDIDAAEGQEEEPAELAYLHPMGAALAPALTKEDIAAHATPRHQGLLEGAGQMLLVVSEGWKDKTANARRYELKDGVWTPAGEEFSVRLGYGGLAYIEDRRQNTGKVPAGVMRITSAFGLKPDPGCIFPYYQAAEDDYWTLDPDSANYNLPRQGSGGGDEEHLFSMGEQYNYVLNTDYNREQEEGKGGAIFLHCNGKGNTAGCVSMAESDMQRLITWVDPVQKPVVLVTVRDELGGYGLAFAPDR